MVVIEVCCDHDSAMGRLENMLNHTLVIRVEKTDDFRKKGVVDQVLDCIRSSN